MGTRTRTRASFYVLLMIIIIILAPLALTNRLASSHADACPHIPWFWLHRAPSFTSWWPGTDSDATWCSGLPSLTGVGAYVRIAHTSDALTVIRDRFFHQNISGAWSAQLKSLKSCSFPTFRCACDIKKNNTRESTDVIRAACHVRRRTDCPRILHHSRTLR